MIAFKRRAQLVAHVGEELGFGAARRLGRFLRAAQLLGRCDFRRDVARRAMIAGEDAGIVEHRHAACTDVMRGSVQVAQLIAEVPERLALFKIGPMFRPRRLRSIRSRKFPTRLADIIAIRSCAQQR